MKYKYIIFLTLIKCCLAANTRITELNSQSSILFERFGMTRIQKGEWSIKTSLDLATLTKVAAAMRDLINSLEEICASTEFINDLSCLRVNQTLVKIDREIAEVIEEWSGKPCKRNKRAAPKSFTEMYLKDVSTTPDEIDGEMTATTIASIFNGKDVQILSINKQISEMTNVSKYIELKQNLQRVKTDLNFLLVPFFYELHVIKNLLRNEMLTERLIPKKSLLEHFMEIERSASFMLPLRPNVSNVDQLYELAGKNVVCTCKTILMTIKVPLVGPEYFNTYKITPIPNKLSVNLYTIIPTGEKEVFQRDSANGNHFFMTADELLRCKFIESMHICKTSEPVYPESRRGCFVDLFLNKKIENVIQSCDHRVMKITDGYFIKLILPDKWAFVFNKEVQIYERCARTEKRFLIKDTGIITLQLGCQIATDMLILSSNNFDKIKQDDENIDVALENITDVFSPKEISNIQESMIGENQFENHQAMDSHQQVMTVGKKLKDIIQMKQEELQTLRQTDSVELNGIEISIRMKMESLAILIAILILIIIGLWCIQRIFGLCFKTILLSMIDMDEDDEDGDKYDSEDEDADKYH